MSTLHPTSTRLEIQALDTYTKSSLETGTWGTGLTGATGGSTVNLGYEFQYPTGLNSATEIPLIIGWAGGGFQTNTVNNITAQFNRLVTAGFAFLGLGYRVAVDTPFHHRQVSGDIGVDKAIQCALIDSVRGYIWGQSPTRRVTSNFTIDPTRIYTVGSSAGSQLMMMTIMDNSNHPFKACCSLNGGFGLEYNATTSNLRAVHTEADWTHDIPCIAFNGDADVTIGTTYVSSLQTRLNLDAGNAVYTESGGTHTGIDTYSDVTCDANGLPDGGGDTVEPHEAIRRFFASTDSGIAAQSSKINIA